MKTKPPRKKLRQLEQALKPYEEFWDLWIISKGCFLTQREIDSILLYRKYQSFALVADEMGITEFSAREILNRALRRLGYNYQLYRHWIADRMLEQAGVYTGMSDLNKFLITPLHYHRLPTKLHNILSVCGDTMGDILKDFGESDLLRLRSFGRKKLHYLKTFLKKNNCIHLLKPQSYEKAKSHDKEFAR